MGGAAAAGIVGPSIGSLVTYGLNAMAASKAHDRSKNMMTRGYLYTQEGLEKAGLNRMLALGAQSLGGSAKAQMAHAASPGKGSNPVLDALSAQNLEANTAKQSAEGRVAASNAVIADLNAKFRASPEGMAIYSRQLTTDSEPKTLPQVGSKFLTNALEAWKNRKGTPANPWRRIDKPKTPRFEDPSGKNWGVPLKARDMRK